MYLWFAVITYLIDNLLEGISINSRYVSRHFYGMEAGQILAWRKIGELKVEAIIWFYLYLSEP